MATRIGTAQLNAIGTTTTDIPTAAKPIHFDFLGSDPFLFFEYDDSTVTTESRTFGVRSEGGALDGNSRTYIGSVVGPGGAGAHCYEITS